MNNKQKAAGQRIPDDPDKATAVRQMPRILVAEDDPEMRRLLVWNLRKEGFDLKMMAENI